MKIHRRMSALRSRTATIVAGVFLAFLTRVTATGSHYVNLNGTAPLVPYTNWVHAALNIQDAVNVASTGDVVWVTNGLYLLDAQIAVTSSITLASVNGAGVTVIDGDHVTRCFQVSAPSAVINGFTLRNGSAEHRGGGILFLSEGELVDCVVYSNTVVGSSNLGLGGGVFFATNGHVRNCILRDNIALGGQYLSWMGIGGEGYSGQGGGVYGENGDLTLSECVVLGNTAKGGWAPYKGWSHGSGIGGGVCSKGTLTCSRCTVQGNRAEGAGSSGTWAEGADAKGGGIYSLGTAEIVNGRVFGNSAVAANGGYSTSGTGLDGGTASGGGTCLEGESQLANCEISGNETRGGAGGNAGPLDGGNGGNGGDAWGALYTATSRVVSLCTTIAGNTSVAGDGGNPYGTTGVHGTPGYGVGGVFWMAEAFVTNCVIHGNTGSNDSNHDPSTTGASYAHCCLDPVAGGPGNFALNPVFISPDADDYRLRRDSPCVDAGTNLMWMAGATDLAGVPRIVGPMVDIGCYEYHPDAVDSDLDGMYDSDELTADTDPLDGDSILEVTLVPDPMEGQRVIQFVSSSNRVYTLECCTNLLQVSWENVTEQSRVPGNGGFLALPDTNSANMLFYRIRVERP